MISETMLKTFCQMLYCRNTIPLKKSLCKVLAMATAFSMPFVVGKGGLRTSPGVQHTDFFFNSNSSIILLDLLINVREWWTMVRAPPRGVVWIQLDE